MVKHKHHSRGFTLVELIIVIVVIGILGTIGVVGYGAATNTSRVNALKADLKTAATALENDRNFSNAYNCTAAASSMSDQVFCTSISTEYCVEGTVNGQSYSINQTSVEVQETDCGH